MLSAVGCTTTTKNSAARPATAHTPSKEASLSAAEAAQPRSATELLRAANEAFRKANEAQESGDREAALRHYTQMLELLIKADLDPGVFYTLRGEFERILVDKGPQEADLSDKDRSRSGDYAKELGDLRLPGPLPERVLQQLDQIQRAYPKNFQAGLNRSYKYAPHIRQEFAKAGLPADLMWLAQVESQFSPKVVSRAGAGGMWQFMRGTAKRYDIRMDTYVDERFNWKKSTRAAVSYLTELYNRFDQNWPLAITAYNMGEGGVERAIAANGGERDLWKLIETPPASNMMQNETKDFYAKLLATIIVARNPDRYGMTVDPRNPDDTVEIPVTGTYALSDLERACGVGEGALQELNPDLLRGVTPPDGHPVVVPSAVREQFLVALNEVPQTKRVPRVAVASLPESERRGSTSNASYVVRKGDTLAAIAAKHHVSVSELASANKMRSSGRLLSGQRLVIPEGPGKDKGFVKSGPDGKVQIAQKKAADAEAQGDTADSGSDVAIAKDRLHRVERGETLVNIAKAENVSVREIVAWNGIKENDLLRVGQQLIVQKGTSKAAVSAKGSCVEHEVKAGDTASRIAQTYNVAIADLYAWNDLGPKSVLKTGQKLVLQPPAGATSVSAAQTSGGRSGEAARASQGKEKSESATRETPHMHTVAKGDTALAIASKYGVPLKAFLEWNNLNEGSVLRVGDECVISLAAASGTLTEKPVAAIPDASAKETAGAASKAGKNAKGASSYRTVTGKGNDAKTTYVVVKGDSPSLIAQKFGVPLRDLYAWNKWDKSTVLRVGQQVTVSRP